MTKDAVQESSEEKKQSKACIEKSKRQVTRTVETCSILKRDERVENKKQHHQSTTKLSFTATSNDASAITKTFSLFEKRSEK